MVKRHIRLEGCLAEGRWMVGVGIAGVSDMSMVGLRRWEGE